MIKFIILNILFIIFPILFIGYDGYSKGIIILLSTNLLFSYLSKNINTYECILSILLFLFGASTSVLMFLGGGDI